MKKLKCEVCKSIDDVSIYVDFNLCNHCRQTWRDGYSGYLYLVVNLRKQITRLTKKNKELQRKLRGHSKQAYI